MALASSLAWFRILRPISVLAGPCALLAGAAAACATSHHLEGDGGLPSPSDAQDAAPAPCSIVPVYAGIRCVGIACDYCPTVEAAFLARSAEIGCCLPFRCDWRPAVPTDVVLASVAASASCDALATAGR